MRGLIRFYSRELIAEESHEVGRAVDVVENEPVALVSLEQHHADPRIVRPSSLLHPGDHIIIIIGSVVISED